MPYDKRYGLIPPGRGEARFPITQGYGLAVPPLIDRYPIIIGQGLSLSYVAAALRTALTGYRQQLVDLLGELLQKDPHAYSVVWKRVLGVAGARLELRSAKVSKDSPDGELADEIRDFCQAQLEQIPYLRKHLAALAWASYYAITSVEIHWDRRDFEGRTNAWVVRELGFIHSRRLSYPDNQTWDLYIWDQGQVSSFQYFGSAPTNSNTYGLRVASFPSKFVVHAPQLRGDYPTREGVGIQIAEWLVLKRLGGRSASQYLERFGKPVAETTWTTSPDGKPRVANDDDIDDAKTAAAGISAGVTTSWAHPDVSKVEFHSPDGTGTKAITFETWLQICNEEISKPVVGNTLTTSVGKGGGNRALGEVHQSEELRILKYDAQALADTIEDQLLRVIVRLNYGQECVRLTPHPLLHVEEPDPAALMDLAVKGAGAGMPVDADRIAEETGVPLVANDTGEARRMYVTSPIPPVGFGPPPGPQPDDLADTKNPSTPDEGAGNADADKPGADAPEKPKT